MKIIKQEQIMSTEDKIKKLEAVQTRLVCYTEAIRQAEKKNDRETVNSILKMKQKFINSVIN